jgi:hypothetical protein
MARVSEAASSGLPSDHHHHHQACASTAEAAASCSCSLLMEARYSLSVHWLGLVDEGAGLRIARRQPENDRATRPRHAPGRVAGAGEVVGRGLRGGGKQQEPDSGAGERA